MRHQSFVQEHHLEEAVRRRVIHEGQMQEILAISRAMGQGGRTPDLGWLAIAQAVFLAGIIGVPGLITFESIGPSAEATPLFAVSVGVTCFLIAATVWLRRRGFTMVTSGITAAGAALWCWGIGAAVFAMTHQVPVGSAESYGNGWMLVGELKRQGQLVGFVTLLLASPVLGLVLRAPATAATGAMGFVGLALHVADDITRTTSGARWTFHAPWFMGVACVLFVAGIALDVKMKSTRSDPAFWLYTAGLFPLALSGVILIDKQPPLTLPMAVVAALTLAAGVWKDRKSVILGGAVALFVSVPLGALAARLGSVAVAGAFALSTVSILIAGVATRRVYLQRAREERDVPERSVWG
jgi:hypothetical protein